MKAILLVCLSLAALAAAQPSSQCQQGIPFGSQPQNVAPVWRYYVSNNNYGNLPPSTWINGNFSDSGWALGAMPFGENIFCGASYSGCAQTGCMSQWVSNAGTPTNGNPGPNGSTDWPRNTYLFLRSHFSSSTSGANVEASLNVVVDNNLIGVWVNGQMVVSGNCPAGSDGDSATCRGGCTGVSQTIPVTIPGNLINVGDNVIAIQVQDLDGANSTSNQSFCNIELNITPVYSPSGQGVSTSPGTCACLTNPTTQ